MNKQEFLSFIEKRLAVLDKNERADILAEFDQHISNKIENGASEEEAIADFGDPDIFVEEILDAYKIDPEYSKNQKTEQAENSFVNYAKGLKAKMAESQILSNIKERGHIFTKERKEKEKEKSEDEKVLIKSLTTLLKVLLVIILIPTIFYAFFNIIALIIAVVGAVANLPFVGITVMAFGSLLCVGSFLIAIYRVAFAKNKKTETTTEE